MEENIGVLANGQQVQLKWLRTCLSAVAFVARFLGPYSKTVMS